MYFADWNVEKAFLATNKDRMQYIADMIIETADKPKGNVLCLVSNIKFGKMLTKLIDGAKFMYGAIEVSDREEVYNEFKTEDHMKVIANAQIAATGLNIPRIFNLMYIDMGKSFIRTIQAIGRGLRKAHDKDSVVAYDICADSKYSKRHLAERVKFYKEAGYPYKKTTIDL
jgi:superfamily II DNA or RNA helicase